MFVLNLIRFIRGYIKFSITGDFVERFINLVTRQHLSLWGSHKKGCTMTAYTTKSDYDQLCKIAETTQCNIEIDKKYGLPFISEKYKKRLGLLTGVLLFSTFVFIMSRFIWSIEISGNESISQEEIVSFLDEQGLKTGVLISSINPRQIEEQALIDLDMLSWMGITQDGTKFIIEIRERVPIPRKEIDNTDPCNIIAKKTGLIVKLHIYAGKPEIVEGDTVMEGEMIVNSIITGPNGNSVLSHARASAIAMIEESTTFEIPINTKIKDYSGNETEKTSIELFGLRIPIGSQKILYQDYDKTSNTENINIFGFSIPVNIIKSQFQEYSWLDQNLTLEESEEKLKELTSEYEEQNFPNAVIISKTHTMREENGVYIFDVSYIYNEDIAIEQEILAEQVALIARENAYK